MQDCPSPNFDVRPEGAAIDMVVLHYTGMPSADAAIERLRQPEAAVSCHYLIDEDGQILRMVDERYRAWHAGKSCWQGRSGLNDVSIGVEIVNPGHEWGYRHFPDPQMASVQDLVADILKRRQIVPKRVVAHSDIAPSRKLDPGELFDWQSLARNGLSIWPANISRRQPERKQAIRALATIGYSFDQQDTLAWHIVSAFQRRFRPAKVDGRLDSETMGLIDAVLALST